MSKKILENRIDMVGYIKVVNANPNGDPDKGNEPRTLMDGHGIITDMALKYKLRDYIEAAHGGEEGFARFIKPDGITLEAKSQQVLEKALKEYGKELKKDPNAASILHRAMADTFFDIRMFGGVVTTFTKERYSDGKINGPVQISFAESLDPIIPEELTITRCSVASEKEKKEKDRNMGNKWIVPFGVYKFTVSVSAAQAEKLGFTEDDLQILIESLFNMYMVGESTSKKGISVDRLFIFRHSSKLGSCRPDRLESIITCDVNPEHKTVSYEVGEVPAGVELTIME